MILFINTCVRPESRTCYLARKVLEHIKVSAEKDEAVIEIRPQNKPLDNETLLLRTRLSEKEQWENPIFTDAKQFASADQIVIAAPYWDLSFPAQLKNYIEAINVIGLTFAYTDEGFPVGLCKAKRLIYITTAGGYIVDDAYGYGYIKELAKSFYGIPDVRYIKAEGLDIIGADVEKILKTAVDGIDEIYGIE